MELVEAYIPQSAAKRPMIKLRPKWVTIHSVEEGPACAQGQRDWLANPENKRQYSVHIVVDEKEALLCVPVNEVAYHAGDGQGDGNRASIGVLICPGKKETKAIQNTAAIVARLMEQYGIPIDNVVKHHKWNGKQCPALLWEEEKWQGFILQVERQASIRTGK